MMVRPHVDERVAAARKAAKAAERARFGTRVRDLRTRAGLTQEHVAAQVPMSRVTLSKVEAGDHDLATSFVRPPSAALGVTPGDLSTTSEGVQPCRTEFSSCRPTDLVA